MSGIVASGDVLSEPVEFVHEAHAAVVNAVRIMRERGDDASEAFEIREQLEALFLRLRGAHVVRDHPEWREAMSE